MKRNNTKPQETKTAADNFQSSAIRSLKSFIAGVGISPVTAWRMEKRGWLKTINIAGRRYISLEAEEEFVRRAASGEFAKLHKTPRRAEAAA